MVSFFGQRQRQVERHVTVTCLSVSVTVGSLLSRLSQRSSEPPQTPPPGGDGASRQAASSAASRRHSVRTDRSSAQTTSPLVRTVFGDEPRAYEACVNLSSTVCLVKHFRFNVHSLHSNKHAAERLLVTCS